MYRPNMYMENVRQAFGFLFLPKASDQLAFLQNKLAHYSCFAYFILCCSFIEHEMNATYLKYILRLLSR